MTTVSQIMAEVGRLHMENLELKSAIATRDERIHELEAVVEGRRQEASEVPQALKAPRSRKPRS